MLKHLIVERNMKLLLSLLLSTSLITAANVGIIRKPSSNLNPYVDDALQIDVDTLTYKISELLSDYPDLDIIVTPEYSLYPITYDSVKTFKSAVTLIETDSGYVVDRTVSSSVLTSAIDTFCAIAKENNTYIFLGTVPEKYYPDLSVYPNMPDSVVINTMLIINSGGVIEDIDRKVSGSDNIFPSPKYYPEYGMNGDSAYFFEAQIVLKSTTYARTLKTDAQEIIRYFPVICAERADTNMIKIAADEEVDLLIESQREGDFFIENAMMMIQSGDTASINTQTGWGWYMDDIMIKLYRDDYSVVHDSGFYLMSHTTFGGLVNLNKRSVNHVDTSAHYIYLEAEIGIKDMTDLSSEYQAVAFTNNIKIYKVSSKEIALQFPRNGIFTVAFYNLMGRKILTEKVTSTFGKSLISLPADFNNSMVLINVQGEGLFSTGKILLH